LLTNDAIIVSTSGESMTQQRKTAQSRNSVYIMRVLVDCFTAGRQLQHRLHVSEQQQHATCDTHITTHSLTLLHTTQHQTKTQTKLTYWIWRTTIKGKTCQWGMQLKC